MRDDAAMVDEIVERLAARFPDIPEPTVREVVTASFDGMRDAHVRDFVAVLVEKEAKKALKSM